MCEIENLCVDDFFELFDCKKGDVVWIWIFMEVEYGVWILIEE